MNIIISQVRNLKDKEKLTQITLPSDEHNITANSFLKEDGRLDFDKRSYYCMVMLVGRGSIVSISGR